MMYFLNRSFPTPTQNNLKELSKTGSRQLLRTNQSLQLLPSQVVNLWKLRSLVIVVTQVKFSQRQVTFKFQNFWLEMLLLTFLLNKTLYLSVAASSFRLCKGILA